MINHYLNEYKCIHTHTVCTSVDIHKYIFVNMYLKLGVYVRNFSTKLVGKKIKKEIYDYKDIAFVGLKK